MGAEAYSSHIPCNSEFVLKPCAGEAKPHPDKMLCVRHVMINYYSPPLKDKNLQAWRSHHQAEVDNDENGHVRAHTGLVTPTEPLS